MRKGRRRRGSSGYVAPHKRSRRSGARAGRRQGSALALGGVALSIGLAAGLLASGAFLAWALLWSDSSIPVHVDQNGFVRTIQTKAETVEALFAQNGIQLRADDLVNYSLSSALLPDMEITIDSAFPVAVASRGAVTILRMHEGSVGEALEKAGIEYAPEDEITRLTYEDVEPGMHIRHISVETRYETVDQVVNYKEEVIRDPSRYTGDDRVKTAGEDGERRIVRRLVYKDGELASREIMNQLILKEAVDEVKIIGTKFRAQTKYTGDTRAWKPKPKDSEIKQTMVVSEITAYTHTGRRTATGKKTQIGYVAVNPSVIPYGTKLYIPGYGYCTAQDTGAFRHEEGGKKNQIDVFLNTEKECRSWGRKHNVTIYILK